MAVITHSSGLPGGRLDVFGDLDLVQKTPLVCSSRKPIRMNKPILVYETSDWLANIYNEYSKRTRELFLHHNQLTCLMLLALVFFRVFSFY